QPGTAPSRVRGCVARLRINGHLAEACRAIALSAFALLSSGYGGTSAFGSPSASEGGWTRPESNRQPPACKAGVLPLNYAPEPSAFKLQVPLIYKYPVCKGQRFLGGGEAADYRRILKTSTSGSDLPSFEVTF